MREIKFKAWDGEDMLTNIDSVNLEELRKGVVEYGDEVSDQKSVVFMQFTGLRDKNGVEIYEGDIIKHPNSTEPEHLGFIVKFENFKWIALCVFPFLDEEMDTQLQTDFSDYFSSCEIIGNIHQNPELLK